MAVEDRREAIIDATLGALQSRRRPLSTREIAEAAGVAEGTIFRIFASKDDLIDAVVAKAFEPPPGDPQVDRIDLDQPLRERLVDFVQIMQTRLQNVLGLMEALGLTAPPEVEDTLEARVRRARRLTRSLQRVVGPDGAQLRVDTAGLLRYLRLLTFSGSHERMCEGRIMTPQEIVDVVLNGVLRPENSLTSRPRKGVTSAGPLTTTTTRKEISC